MTQKKDKQNGAGKATKPEPRRPIILVLEGLSGAGYAVRQSGAVDMTISPWDVKAMDRALNSKDWDGLLLTGGGDVDPRLYGAKPHKKIYGVNETRDLVEIVALEKARELGKPVLGICRGSQIMCVEAGGTLLRHLRREREHRRPHLVFSEPHSRLRGMIGHQMLCESHHHQAVNRLPAGFKIAALASDGVVEAIESRDGRCLGVQFHPEMDFSWNEASRKIFSGFVARVARSAKLPVPKTPYKLAWLSGGTRQSRWWDDEYDGTSSNTVLIPPAPQHRKAGNSTRPRRGRSGPVLVSWLCPKCALRFDKLEDREDHMTWVHGDPIIPSESQLQDMGLDGIGDISQEELEAECDRLDTILEITSMVDTEDDGLWDQLEDMDVEDLLGLRDRIVRLQDAFDRAVDEGEATPSEVQARVGAVLREEVS